MLLTLYFELVIFKMILKSCFVIGLSFLSFSAVAQSQTLTQKMLAPVISLRCESELNTSKLWRASTVLMSQNKRDDLKTKICDCVGDNALNGVDKKTIAKAMVNDEHKNELIKTAVLNSLNACVGKAVS